MNNVIVPNSVLDELKRVELRRIFVKFSGMDERYVSFIREYHAMANQRDVYNTSYLDEKRKEITNSISALQREHVRMANEEIEVILLEHQVKPDTKPVPHDTQERIAYELERQNDMKQWELQFQSPELDLETLKTMYDKNWGESDFITLFNIEVEKIKEKDSHTYMQLMAYIEGMKTSPVVKELEDLRRGFNMYASMEYYPYNLVGGTIKGVEMRNVYNDLTIPENFNNLLRKDHIGVLGNR